MDTSCSSSSAELVQRLHALTRQASADGDGLQLPELADKLTALAEQIRLASHTSAAAGPAGTSAGASGADITTAASRGGISGDGDATGSDGADGGPAIRQPSKKQRRAPREFDFSRYRTRYVALELMYVGWGFQGFARQDNTENTIEGVLFAALRKVKLIPEAAAAPISELNYSRCGRTDRGVSALGQVVALRLRSCARVDEPDAAPDAEYDYPRLVNKALPPEVRVLGWAPVADDFNARFSAQYREYKYFIVQEQHLPPPWSRSAAVAAAGANTASVSASASATEAASAPAALEPGSGASPPAATPPAAKPAVTEASRGGCSGDVSLDIGAMRAAAARFVGEHDFRNFCKADVAAVRSFRRRILSFSVDPVATSAGPGAARSGGEEAKEQEGMAAAASAAAGRPHLSPSAHEALRVHSPHRVYAMTVRGSAFLWHQVRCMAAVLLMVGRGQERPEVVSELLDIGAHPRKPQYSMAPEEPLLLYACGFRGLTFRRSAAAVEANLADVAALTHRHLIGAALTAACHARLAADDRCRSRASGVGDANGDGKGTGGGGGGGAASHIPLLWRQTEPSIEERMARRGIPWPPEPRAEGGTGPGCGGEEDDPMVE